MKKVEETKDSGTYLSTTCRVRIRSLPSLESEEVDVLPKDTFIETFGEDGEWTKVDGGYIKSEFLA